jgi:hypothetical protein
MNNVFEKQKIHKINSSKTLLFRRSFFYVIGFTTKNFPFAHIGTGSLHVDNTRAEVISKFLIIDGKI